MISNARPLYLDHTADIPARVSDLLSRMTRAEKVSRMLHTSAAIPRLGIPEYNWWSESLHGVARAGIATVFPQSIGMAASFNTDLMRTVAAVISDEARAKHHEFARRGDRSFYKGLNECAPNINIFRDPRWGRGQETYGEDPCLTARMGVAYVKGLQGDDARYLKTAAIAKHYAVHSGPETMRHGFDARVSPKDLKETYLYAFKELVREANVAGVMGAYNSVNGEPCCASPTLLRRMLREEWGFQGYTVSDYGAIDDIHNGHKATRNEEESSVMAVKCGCNHDCGWSYASLRGALEKGLISEAEIDDALRRTLTVLFRLGLFDPEEVVPYARIPYEVVDSDAHRALALEMARQSIVLLRNEAGILPLDRNIRRIAVIGPNADSRRMLVANYSGTPSRSVTFLEGIREKVGKATVVDYREGCDYTTDRDASDGRADRHFTEAVAAAESAEVVVMCMGLSADVEGEETGANEIMGRVSRMDPSVLRQYFSPETVASLQAFSRAGGDDRGGLELPGMQAALLRRIAATGKPVVLVLANGSPVDLAWASENVAAIVEAWYPGEEGGTALADALFGDISPAGRLPVTFVRSTADLPAFESYAMEGRTYRYMKGDALYPFGYGRGYARFRYSGLKASAARLRTGETLRVSVDVENRGAMAADEVVQVYLRDLQASCPQMPRWSLISFTRVRVAPGSAATCSFDVTPRDMALIDDEGRCVLEPGAFRLYVGGQQPDARSAALTGQDVLSVDFEVTGERRELAY